MQPERKSKRAHAGRGASLVVLCALVASVVPALFIPSKAQAQQSCSCRSDNGLGGCLHDSLTDLEDYPGDFAGSAVVTPPGPGATRTLLFIADLYGGFTFRYDAADLDRGVISTLISPHGSAATTGVAYHSGEDKLYWAIDNILVRTDVARSALDTTFAGASETGEVDLAGLAEALFGDANRAGTLGGLTYHSGRETLWAIDVVNDVYFEINTDGSLSTDGEDGPPIHFFNPKRDANGGGAYGNSITYVVSGDAEFFDIPVGSVIDERPVSVLRVHAPTAADGDGPAIGDETGAGYGILPDLLSPGRRETAFPTGIAFFGNSCAAGNGSEFIVVHDVAGQATSILEVTADEPVLKNVADFTCSGGEGAAVSLMWTPTDYDTLQIFRRSLTDGVGRSERVLNTTAEDDRGSFTDVGFSVPPDGTYEYSIRTARGGTFSLSQSCVVAVGRGALVDATPLTATEANTTLRPPLAAGITQTTEHLLIADANTGIAQRFRLDNGEADGVVAGPIGFLGRTSGVEYNPDNGRLYWVGSIGPRNVIQSTLPDGTGTSATDSIQTPIGLLRTPTLGDLSYDAAAGQFWIVDTLNSSIFACGLDGHFVENSLIEEPEDGRILGSGIDISASNDTSFTVDLTTGPITASSGDSLTRLRFIRSNLRSSEWIYTVHLSGVLNATTPVGLLFSVNNEGTPNESLSEHVVASDTNLLYELRMNDAQLDSLPLRRGDANNDGSINISDPSYILSTLFLGDGARPLACQDSADSDDSGAIEITDAIVIFDWLFRGGVSPQSPSPGCGFDATPSALACETSFCADGGNL